MIRLNKMTDYAVVMLSHLAVDSDRVVTAKELARGSALPLPSVSKLMKQLSKAGILTSHRGASGGYRLGRAPKDISVAEIVTIFEGPIALTACIEGADTSCDAMPQCSLSGHWNQVNHAIVPLHISRGFNIIGSVGVTKASSLEEPGCICKRTFL